jgi:hypothetical protein
MEPGAFVRHRVRPEWGIGQVLLRTDDQIAVRFPHAVVRLKLAVAASHLEPVSATDAATDTVRSTTRRQGPAKTASAPRRLPRGEKARPPDPPDD